MKCVLEGPGLKGGSLGSSLVFYVNTVDNDKQPVNIGTEVIEVNIFDAVSKKNIQPKIVEEKNGVYRIEYVPTNEGNYLISVSLFGKAIFAKPLSASVSKPKEVAAPATASPVTVAEQHPSRAGLAEPHSAPLSGAVGSEVGSISQSKPAGLKCSITGEGLKKGTVGASNTFEIKCTQSGKPKRVDADAISVNVRGPGFVQPQITDNRNGSYTVVYNPSKSGEYHISITLYGKSILPRPLVVVVTDGTTVQTRSSQVTQTTQEPTLSTKVATTKEAETPTLVQAKLSGVSPTGTSSAAVDGSKSSSGVRCSLKGPGLKGAVAGVPATFVLSCSTASGQPAKIDPSALKVEIKGAGSVTPSISYDGNGTFTITYTASGVGQYSVQLYLHGKAVLAKPIVCQVTPAETSASGTATASVSEKAAQAKSLKCTLQGAGLKIAKIGQNASFKITVKGEDGKPKIIDPKEIVVSFDGPSKITPQVIDHYDGTYTINYTASVAGSYLVSISIFGRSILGKPVPISVTPLPSANYSMASGPGLTQMVSGKANEFLIYAKDSSGRSITQGGDKFEVNSSGPAQAKIELKDNGNGTYTVIFTPTVGGEYNVEILYGGAHIKGSPYKITCVSERGLASHSDYDVDESAVLSKKETIKITAHDENGKPKRRGGDFFEVEVIGPRGKIDAETKDNNDGSYTAEYWVTNGEYKVSAKLNGKHVKGSPFTQRIF
eukprot:TRINITY_DN4477_c0_g2_i1.p1 TRINITY_DN4477_c0_g2~~TRINITY_DN4477_c0_g2_i1.p1  ORF type:complete len:719 (+),score=220.11 TRINITY_DN4477_c0_g2_i1:100-2256(+)